MRSASVTHQALVTALCSAVLLAPFARGQTDVQYLTGTIVDQEGNATKMSRVEAKTSLTGKFKGKELYIELTEIKRLDNLGQGMCRVTNKAGDDFTVEEASVGKTGTILYRYFDEITKAEKRQSVPWSRVATLSLDEEMGRLKFNPRTKKYFPPDYMFDPFSGEQLEWKDLQF